MTISYGARLVMVLCLVVLGVAAPFISSFAYPISDGQTSNWTVCKDAKGEKLETSFPPEQISLFRERNRGNAQGELASRHLSGQNVLNCSFSNNRFRSVDQAQTLVAADLLSRTKELVLETQKQTYDSLQQMIKCEREPSSKTDPCELYRRIVRPGIAKELENMRVARALAQAEPDSHGCDGYRSLIVKNQSNPKYLSDSLASGPAVSCFMSQQLSHDRPFLSKIFDLNDGVSEIAPLTDKEKAIVSGVFTGNQREFFADAKTAKARGLELKRASQEAYERILIEYPVLNHIKGSSLDLSDAKSGKSALLQALETSSAMVVKDLNRVKQEQDLTKLIAYDGVVAKALSEVEVDQRGNYCEIASRLNREIDRRKMARTALVAGMGIATMGLGLVPASVVGGAAELAQAFGTVGDYSELALRCQSSAVGGGSVCSPERVKAAREALYSPTDGALFIGGGAMDVLGAISKARKLKGAGNVAEDTWKGKNGEEVISEAHNPHAGVGAHSDEVARDAFYQETQARLQTAELLGDTRAHGGSYFTTASYPKEVNGQKLQIIDQYVGNGAYRYGPGQKPVRVLGRNESGELVAETYANGRKEYLNLSKSQEEALSQQSFNNASREVYLMQEARTVTVTRVKDRFEMDVQDLGRSNQASPAQRLHIPTGVDNSAKSVNPTHHYDVQLKSADGEKHQIQVILPTHYETAEEQAKALARVQNAIKELPADQVKSIRTVEITSFDSVKTSVRSDGSIAVGGREAAYATRGEGWDGYIAVMDSGMNPSGKLFPGDRYGAVPTHADELVDLLWHEHGHSMIGKFDRERATPPGWEAAMAHDGRAISEYGKTNSAEDWAESIRKYMATDGGRKDPSVLSEYEHRFRLIRQSYIKSGN